MKVKAQWILSMLVILLLVSYTAAFAQDDGTPPSKDGTVYEAPFLQVKEEAKVIPDRYIVVFKSDTSSRALESSVKEAAEAMGAEVHYVYTAAVKGFAATMSREALEALRKNPSVAYIEPDQAVSISGSQANPTWGIDRIDQTALPLNSVYNYNYTGAGVRAYIIDTGIRLTHNEFGGRAISGYTAISDGNGTNDCNGHGTHVAGTVGGSTYGVAKGVTLYAVRVLDCEGSGTDSGVIAGVDWVTQNHVKPAVANMSLGGSASTTLDNAIKNSIAAGVTYAIAAGNDNLNACNYSPARVPEALTVGSTTSTDARSSFSNYGTCLDLFAPGSSITSSWYDSNTAINTISGTSMATPHVCGVAALYLEANPSALPAAVASALINGATANVVTSPGTGSPNRLLYSLLGSTPPDPTPTPTATPTATPDPGGNVIVNGGFENGTTPWTQYSSGGYTLITTDKPHTGSYGVWAGGYNKATEYIYQTVTIPANGQLTYWWYMSTQESGSTAYDYLRVRLYKTNGSLLKTLRTFSNASTKNTWSMDTLNLSSYAGQTLRINFYVTNDSTLPTSFYVDDVNLH